MSERWSERYELFGAWCAPIFTLLTAIGFLGLSHMYDPAAAHLSPVELSAFYADRHVAVEVGMSLLCVGTAFLAIFSVQLGIELWRIEGRSILMSASQALGGFGVVMLIFISCCLWIGAAYRAGNADPDVTVALNDAAWFGFLVGWVMLALQMATTAAITLHDKRADPLVPRWFSWAAAVGAVLLVTANGCAVTKTGPFAWDGVLGYYLPMAIWGTWLDGHAVLVRRAVRARHAAAVTVSDAASSATDEPRVAAHAGL
ncbi:MAG: hypothetical protein JWM31_2850 [Solirubrobacterales bacterium]|nr:hypothetical protein [Solirubrobacterales bacterium]